MLPIKIFLDLDDVLNRFTLYALAHVGCPVNFMSFDDFNPEWGWDIVLAANELSPDGTFTAESFWSEITQEFWATVPLADGLWFLLNRCEKLVGKENVCVLSSPTSDPACAAGKMIWIHNNLPQWLHRQFLIGPCKHFCATPDALLIDDSDKNVDQFRKHGGQAILVPRPWNSLYEKNADEHLKEAFGMLFEHKKHAKFMI